MPWNSTSPDGTKSVQANRVPMAQNTTYTETTLNVDHYWNIGTDEDGHHKQVQMPKTESGGNPADITLATGMDGGTYLKETAEGDVQEYYRNSSNIYQITPKYLTGTVVMTANSVTTIVAVPDDSYGDIYLYTSTGHRAQTGFFVSNSGFCYGYANGFFASQAATVADAFVKFIGNNGTTDLNLKGVSSSTQTYNYRIKVWEK